jgi:hypothetical protein
MVAEQALQIFCFGLEICFSFSNDVMRRVIGDFSLEYMSDWICRVSRRKVDELKVEVQNVFADKQCSSGKTPQSPSEFWQAQITIDHLQHLSST